MTDPNDADLRGEFGLLCERHGAGALRRARARLGPTLRRRLDSQDLVQEAFVAALPLYEKVRERLRDGESAEESEDFAAWIARIIENKTRELIRFHKRQKRDVRRELAADSSSEIRHAGQATPSSILAASDRAASVREAVQSLPPRQREVIELIDIGELSVEEAARRMRKTPNATSVLRWKALRKLGASLRRRDL